MTKNELIQTLAGIVRVQNPQGCEAIRALLLEASNLVKAPEPPPMPTAPSFNDGLPPPAPTVQAIHPDTLIIGALSYLVEAMPVRLAYSKTNEEFRAIAGGASSSSDTLREAIQGLVNDRR